MTEIIDATVDGDLMQSTELVAYNAPLPAAFVDDPEAFLEEATHQAKVLKTFLDKTDSVMTIGKSEHVKAGGWQFLAQQARLSVGTTAEPVDLGGETGWKGHAIVFRDGIQVGEADALCLRSEANWKNRDTYALCSMAQTRALSKAIKGVLGFVVVMAGYSDTPAEEMVTSKEAAKPDKTAAMRARIKELSIQADEARGELKTADEVTAAFKELKTTMTKATEEELAVVGTDLKIWIDGGCNGDFKLTPF